VPGCSTTHPERSPTMRPVGRVYGTPPLGSPVIAELTNELKATFKRASKERKSQFQSAMAAARKVNKDAWFSTLVSLTESFVDQLDQVFRLQVLHVGTSC